MMLPGKDCVSNQRLEEISGTETSQHDLEPSVSPESVSESSPEPNSPSSTSHGETVSRSDDLDPHICKDWPCPKCHPPRDTQEESRSRAVEAQHSLQPAASAQTSVFRPDPEPHRMEESESEDLQLQVLTGAQAQNHKEHRS